MFANLRWRPESGSGRAAGPSGGQAGPVVSLGSRTVVAWREDVLTRAMELNSLRAWIQAQVGEDEQAAGLLDATREHLCAAKTAAGDPERFWRRFKSWFGGSSFERALGNLDAVEADLLRLAPTDYVRGLMPSIQAHVNRHLPKDDPRWGSLTSVAKTVAKGGCLSQSERDATIAAYHAANSQRRRELLRLRSFRNVLLVATVLLLLVAVALGTLGSIKPNLIPMCFVPNAGTPSGEVVCPTDEEPAPGGETVSDPADVDTVIAKAVSPWDIWLIELVGLVAAAVASAFALRGIQGDTTPITLPAALAVLKLATGALTAFLGLLLMRGGFVPGLSALDTSAQILSWAIVFGYAQQLFTRFVDQQASTVAEGISGRGAAGDRQSTRRAAQTT